MSKANEYVEQYAQEAMEQMRKYGIPASVTLAQGILESASGQSELSRKGNNHFGIKATQSWLSQGGAYLVYTDDRPNEKFCRYASVADSFEHHSLFLRANSRYDKLFSLSPDDYVGWTRGLQEAGYATSSKYAASLQSVIRSYGLDKYDQMVLAQQGQRQGVSTGLNSSNGQNREIVQPVAAQLKRGEEIVQAVPGQMEESSSGPSKRATAEQTAGQGTEQSVSGKQDAKTNTQQNVKSDSEYFHTITANAATDAPLGENAEESNSWERFLGASGGLGNFGSDPVVELASSLFAGLMAIAVQIDSMEEGAALEVGASQEQGPSIAQSQYSSASLGSASLAGLSSTDANALASRNFDAALEQSASQSIRRNRT